MPNNIERFTQRARRVLSLAQEHAECLKHDSIRTEHLLLGLMQEEGGVASRVLSDLGLSSAQMSEAVQYLTADEQKETDQVDLSPGIKKALENAVDEAGRMGHHYIGTEHLLLGLIKTDADLGRDVLHYLGTGDDEIRQNIRRVLQEGPFIQTRMVELGTSAGTRVFGGGTTSERHKILSLIEAGTLTAEQGTAMMQALSPQFMFIFPTMNMTGYTLRLVVTHPTDKTIKSEMTLTIDELQNLLQTSWQMLSTNQTGKVYDHKGDLNIEIHIDKADDESE